MKLAKTKARSYHSCPVSKTLQGHPVSLSRICVLSRVSKPSRHALLHLCASSSRCSPSCCFCTAALASSLFLTSTKHVHASAPLHWLCPLAEMLSTYTSAWLSASSPSEVSRGTFSDNPAWVAFPLVSLSILFHLIVLFWHYCHLTHYTMFICLVSVSTLPPRM